MNRSVCVLLYILTWLYLILLLAHILQHASHYILETFSIYLHICLTNADILYNNCKAKILLNNQNSLCLL